MDNFFYNLNDKLNAIRATPEVTHKQLNERDEGKPGKNFAKIAKDAAERYGSKAAGERVAGAVRNKLKAQGKLEEGDMDESAFQAAIGKKKYGDEGMKALQKAGRDHAGAKTMSTIRNKYDKYDEGMMDTVKKIGKRVASGVNRLVGHGSDEDMRRDVQRKAGAPVTGKKPEQKTTEAAKYRDPKYKDRLYTQQPPDYTYGPDYDDAYDNPKPDDYAGRKRKIGGGEFDHNDPLVKGFGRSGTGSPVEKGPRKGLPTRNQISSLKGSIKAARGTHAEPNLPEASGSIDYEKVLEAIAALYGDDMWENDAMGDLAQDLEQAGPTDRELDFIIAKGKLPTRLKSIRFTNTDDVQFGHLDEKSGDPMTAKQKSFAKLAPPANKITFADKIAGAKKEVDEMLGDVAAEAMRGALSGGQKKLDKNQNGKLDANDFAMLRKGAKKDHSGEMDEENDFTAHQRPAVTQPKVGSTERGHKHDIKHTATGRMVTRRTDPQGNSVGADDASDTQAGPRGRGRPKGTKGAIGAKGPSGKSKLMTKEGEVDIRDQGEYDQEGDMAKDDIKTIVRHAQALSKVLGDNDNLPEWVQSKLAKIEGMMISIDEYMQNQAGEDDEEPIAEEPRSKNQAVAARIARGVQKGTAKAKPGSASAEMAKMQPKELNKFAKGSTKGLPKKVPKNKEEVDENSEDGRLTTTRTGPGQTSTSSSTGRISATVDKGQVTVKPAKSGGTSYGKGIYDSMNYELELMIAESMSVNMSDSTEGNKSLTVTATDEDAMKLAMILKSAGLGGGDAHGGDMHSHGEEACDTCGMQDCGCGDVQEAVDENAPDWPTNTEQADNNFGYAGGLNKPKADVAGNGQSTVPVVATRPHNDDLRRMKEMAGIQNEDNIDLGPTSPEIARMSKDEVNAALRSGMSSPDISAMSSDEVNAALRSGMSPDISDMNPDSDNAEFGKDSIQRMREMAGIKEAKKATRDWDKDGNIESGPEEHAGSVDNAIKKAQAEKKVDESIFALTNQWKAYKG